jgi:preprotein translocase subunit YajC
VNYLPLIIIAVILLSLMMMARRNRQRAADRQNDEREQIRFGTEVMTTSGLYGTVVGFNDDDTVQLAIAPGIEVKWAVAALRDVASLPKPPGRTPAGEDEPGDPAESSDPPGS